MAQVFSETELFADVVEFGEIVDLAKRTAITVSRNVAATNRQALESLGRRIAGQAIFSASSPLPSFVRDYLQPGFVAPPPTPKWVGDVVDPIVAPILKGAKKEALIVANRVTMPLYVGLAGTALTIFVVGYIVGSRRAG